MTVPAFNITTGPYTGNGLLDTYSFDFPISDNTEILVFQKTADGVETQLTLGVDYSVVVGEIDGTVTRLAGNLPTGVQWLFVSNVSQTQLTAFESQGGFFPDVHEDALDKLTIITQQMAGDIGRSLRISRFDEESGVSSTLPPASPGSALIWGNTGFENLPLNFGVLDQEGTVVTPTIALLRTLSGTDGGYAFVAGYYTPGDGGGGPLRVWKTGAIGTYTDNGGSIIVPTGGDGSGAWVWEWSGAVNVKWFGAQFDNALIDNQGAIQSAFDAGGNSFVFDSGDVYTSTVELATNNARVVCNATIKRFADGTLCDFVVNLSGDFIRWEGGRVSWNIQAADAATGRGEAVRVAGKQCVISGLVAADTRVVGTGNGFHVTGRSCILRDCGGDNISYAGVRTTMGGEVVTEAPDDARFTLINFNAYNCYRGYNNNGHCKQLIIDNLMYGGPVQSSEALPGIAGGAFNVESGPGIFCDTVIIKNTNIDTGPDRTLGKVVSWKKVIIDKCQLTTAHADEPAFRYQLQYGVNSGAAETHIIITDSHLTAPKEPLNNDDDTEDVNGGKVTIYSKNNIYHRTNTIGDTFGLDLGACRSFTSEGDIYRADSNIDRLFRILQFDKLAPDLRYLKVFNPTLLEGAKNIVSVISTAFTSTEQMVFVSTQLRERYGELGVLTGGSGRDLLVDQTGNREFRRTRAVVDAGADWKKGDRLYNLFYDLAPGGNIGQVCTTAGVGGSTAVFKNFGAVDA